MEINLSQNKNIDNIKISIEYNNFDEKVKNIVSILNDLNKKDSKIIGIKDDKIFFLSENDIYVIFSEGASIFAITDSGKFLIKERLYEIEERLKDAFVRISKSSIVNMDKITSLEMDFNGKMKMYLKNNMVEYTSRNYLNIIRKKLGILKK